MAGNFFKNTKKWRKPIMSKPIDNVDKTEPKTKEIKLDEPVSFAEFKALHPATQALYVKALYDRYHVNNTEIAELLGCDVSTFCKIRKTLDVNIPPRPQKNPTQAKAWHELLNKKYPAPKNEVTVVGQDNVGITGDAEVVKHTNTKASTMVTPHNIVLSFEGKLRNMPIEGQLYKLCDSTKDYSITIKVYEKK